MDAKRYSDLKQSLELDAAWKETVRQEDIGEKGANAQDVLSKIVSNYVLADVETTQAPLAALSEEKKAAKYIPTIKDFRVYYNTVVVFFADGTKESVTCDKADTFDLNMGIMLCIMKKLCGHNMQTQIDRVIARQLKAEKAKKLEELNKIDEQKRREQRQKKLCEKKLRRRARRELELENIKKQMRKEANLNY